jgi:hypothetical protein
VPLCSWHPDCVPSVFDRLESLETEVGRENLEAMAERARSAQLAQQITTLQQQLAAQRCVATFLGSNEKPLREEIACLRKVVLLRPACTLSCDLQQPIDPPNDQFKQSWFSSVLARRRIARVSDLTLDLTEWHVHARCHVLLSCLGTCRHVTAAASRS